jgi:hypothetical protein
MIEAYTDPGTRQGRAEGRSRIGEQALGNIEKPLLAGRGLPWIMMSANLGPRTAVARD